MLADRAEDRVYPFHKPGSEASGFSEQLSGGIHGSQADANLPLTSPEPTVLSSSLQPAPTPLGGFAWNSTEILTQRVGGELQISDLEAAAFNELSVADQEGNPVDGDLGLSNQSLRNTEDLPSLSLSADGSVQCKFCPKRTKLRSQMR